MARKAQDTSNLSSAEYEYVNKKIKINKKIDANSKKDRQSLWSPKSIYNIIITYLYKISSQNILYTIN